MPDPTGPVAGAQPDRPAAPEPRPRLHQVLYAQVLFAILCGVLIGHLAPQAAVQMKPLGDGFIKLIKMLIGPIVFCTLVTGIAGMRDLKKVGRVGGKALLYFEVVSTFALALGLLVANTLRPGAGFNVDVATLDPAATADFTARAHAQTAMDFVLGIIPGTLVDPFVHGDILQVLLVGILFGFALSMLGETGHRLTHAVELVGKAVFAVSSCSSCSARARPRAPCRGSCTSSNGSAAHAPWWDSWCRPGTRSTSTARTSI